MTDKEKIREFLVGMANADCCVTQVAKAINKIILPYIDSLQEEPVSEELEKELNRFLDNTEGMPRMWHSDEQMEWGKDIARHFANWQKQQIIEKACEWVRTHRDADFFELIPEYNYCGAGNLNIKKMVEEFRKYLEE